MIASSSLPMIDKLYMNEKEASIRYGYSTAWFQRSRWAGNGPPFLTVSGKVLYPIKEVDEWFMKNGLKESTSA